MEIHPITPSLLRACNLYQKISKHFHHHFHKLRLFDWLFPVQLPVTRKNVPELAPIRHSSLVPWHPSSSISFEVNSVPVTQARSVDAELLINFQKGSFSAWFCFKKLFAHIGLARPRQTVYGSFKRHFLTTLSKHTPSEEERAYLPAYSTDSYSCGKWFFTNFIL